MLSLPWVIIPDPTNSENCLRAEFEVRSSLLIEAQQLDLPAWTRQGRASTLQTDTQFGCVNFTCPLQKAHLHFKLNANMSSMVTPQER